MHRIAPLCTAPHRTSPHHDPHHTTPYHTTPSLGCVKLGIPTYLVYILISSIVPLIVMGMIWAVYAARVTFAERLSKRQKEEMQQQHIGYTMMITCGSSSLFYILLQQIYFILKFKIKFLFFMSNHVLWPSLNSIQNQQGAGRHHIHQRIPRHPTIRSRLADGLSGPI